MAVEGFYLAIATLDGSTPICEPWHDGSGPLMMVHATVGGELVTNGYGELHWELVEREEWISLAEGMAIKHLQHFEPVGARSPGD